jgi:hypothetical protein
MPPLGAVFLSLIDLFVVLSMHDVSLPVSYQALVEDLPRELAAEAEVPAAVVATLERIEGDAWNRWRRQLDLPARTRRLLRALDSRQAPIEWGQTSFTAQQAAEVTEAPSLDELRRWLRRLSSSRKRSAAAAVEQWLAGKAGAAASSAPWPSVIICPNSARCLPSRCGGTPSTGC